MIKSRKCKSALQTHKTQYVHLRFHRKYFLLPWNIPEEIISRQSMLFNLGILLYTISNVCHTILGVDWPDIWRLVEISTYGYHN